MGITFNLALKKMSRYVRCVSFAEFSSLTWYGKIRRIPISKASLTLAKAVNTFGQNLLLVTMIVEDLINIF